MSTKKTKQRSGKASLAITGTSGLIGSRLLEELLNESDTGRIIAIDKAQPSLKNKSVRFVKVDIAEDTAVEKIGGELKRNGCTILIHCALPSSPSPHEDAVHELQVSGTMHVLLACEMAGTTKAILPSTTEVYGAQPENPNFLTEDEPLRGGRHSPFFRDKIDVEKQFLRFQRRFPKKVVTILRPCTIVGPNVVYSKTSFLTQPTVPTVLGFDPLMQFVHIKDVLRAIMLAIYGDFRGIFNIVGDGVLSLSRALKITGKVNLPTSSFLLYPAAQTLWNLNIGPAPANHIDYLKYNFIADGSKARKIMKFEPIYSSEEALLSLISIEEVKERLNEDKKRQNRKKKKGKG